MENDIRKIIKSDIELPIHYQNIVRKTLYECEHKDDNKLKNIIKIIGTVCACIIMTTGIVYGGYIVYEKIWKDPQQYSRDEYLSLVPNKEISQEEKVSYITEEQAKKNSLEILNKLGYENQTINRIELKRSYNSYSNAYYVVKTKYGYEEGLMISINAENGEFDHFEDMELKYKNVNPDEITEERAKQIGEEVYQKMGLKEGEYEFFSVEQQQQLFQEKSMNVWRVEFCKKQDGIFNENAAFGVVFIVEKNEVRIVSMGVRHDNNFQSDEVKITKEQAISIALEKEKEYSTQEIKEIVAELSIEKMNTFFYRLDNDVKNKYLKIDEISRKVWKVKIIHDNINTMNKFDRCYYIDSTTGEIIGGEFVTN